MLFLVEFVRFCVRADGSDRIDGRSHRTDVTRTVPVHQLRTGHCCIRPERLLDEKPNGVWLERHVVVNEEIEGRAFDCPTDTVGCCAVAHDRRVADDCRRWENRLNLFGEVTLAGVDAQHSQLRIVLRSEASQDVVEPEVRVVRNEDGDHRRGCAGLGGHDQVKVLHDIAKSMAQADLPPTNFAVADPIATVRSWQLARRMVAARLPRTAIC